MANTTFSQQVSEPTTVQQISPMTTGQAVASVLPTVLSGATLVAQDQQISHINDMGEALQEVQKEASNGQNILSELNKSLMDDTSKQNVQSVFSQLSALQSGQTQGAITPSEARVRAATVYRRAVASNPGLAPEYERVYGALGFASSQGAGSGGKTGMPMIDAAQEAYSNLIKQSINTGKTIDQTIHYNADAQAAQHSSDLATIAANNGKLQLPFAVQAVGQASSKITNDILDSFQQAGAVKGSTINIEDFKTLADQAYMNLRKQTDDLIATNASKGNSFSSDQVSQLYNRIDQEHQALTTLLSTNDPAAKIKRLNDVTKDTALRENQTLLQGMGLPGRLALNMSPDNSSAYLLASINILQQYGRAKDNGARTSLRSNLEEAARLSGDTSLMTVLSLVDNAQGGPLLNYLTDQASAGDLSGSPVITQTKEGITSSAVDEGLNLGDPSVLGSFIKGAASSNATSVTSSNFTKPQIVDQARKDPKVKESLNNSINMKSDFVARDIQNIADQTQNFNFKFDPTSVRPFSASATYPVTGGSVEAFVAAGNAQQGGPLSGTAPIGVDQTRQLNDFYQFKVQVDGPASALDWARKLTDRINPQPSLDNAGTDDFFFRVK